jgi:hypothetical protein
VIARLLGLGVCTASLFAAQSSALFAAISNGPRSHLYMSLCASASDCVNGTVGRYKLTNGIPAQTPDLVYQNDDGPIAVAPNGQLYANYPGISSGFQPAVDVFAAGSTRQLRRLILPAGSFLAVLLALAVDARGYLYASWFNVPPRAGPMRPDQNGSGALFVYAPGAKNNDPPINTLFGIFDGIAIDAHGALYASQEAPDGHEVDVFTNPETSLVPSRTFTSPWIQQPQGVALDSAGVFHILDTTSEGEDYIASFSAAGSGPVRPLGIFRALESRALYSGIAVSGRILYLPVFSNSTLVGYPASPHGGPAIFTLTLPHAAQDVAVGP